MNKAALARNLAASLTLGAWTPTVLEAALRRRLPRGVQGLAGPVATELTRALPLAYAPADKTVVAALLAGSRFGRIYRHCARHGLWPTPDLSTPVMVPIAAFADLPVPALPTYDMLADWLMVPADRLDILADPHNRAQEHGEIALNHYHYMIKTKSSGGHRVIEAPKERLKQIQRQILTGILDTVPLHPDCFGFARGRSCLDGAARHASEAVVICFDLKDFFPSVRAARVFGLFRCLGYPPGVARHLTALTTTVTPGRITSQLGFEDRRPYRQPHLPQGAPSSPALANHAAFSLDRRLSGLARRIGANYSRYADDLSFSGDANVAQAVLDAVPGIVRDEGFALNPAKTRVQMASGRQSVTGIVVNSHLNISREVFDELKAIIHACARPTDPRLTDPAFCASLVGRLDWVARLNPRRGAKLRRLLDAALEQRAGQGMGMRS